MGLVKLKSTLHVVINQLLKHKTPAFEDHPSWLTGIQALEEFHEWVGTVVLPIAFAWIEHKDNYDKVYDIVRKLSDDPKDPEKYFGDVGAVIAAAFELVKETDYYKKGVDAADDLRAGRVKTSELNLTWTRITTAIRKSTADIFEKERKYLDGTIIKPHAGDHH
jgi:hypothetical protein